LHKCQYLSLSLSLRTFCGPRKERSLFVSRSTFTSQHNLRTFCLPFLQLNPSSLLLSRMSCSALAFCFPADIEGPKPGHVSFASLSPEDYVIRRLFGDMSSLVSALHFSRPTKLLAKVSDFFPRYAEKFYTFPAKIYGQNVFMFSLSRQQIDHLRGLTEFVPLFRLKVFTDLRR